MFSHACRAAIVAALIAVLSLNGAALAIGAAVRTEANDRELENLDAAARRYRVQVYETYRLDRSEFDRRKAAGDAVQARWQAAGGRKDDLGAVLHWLEQATYLSQPDVRRNLPSFPQFGPSGNNRSVVASRIAAPAKASQPSVPADANHTSSAISPPPARVNNPQHVQLPQPPSTQGALPQVGRALLPAPWEVVSRAPWQPPAATDPGRIPRAELSPPPTPSRVERPGRARAGIKAPERASPGTAPEAPLQPAPSIDAVQAPASKVGAPTSIVKPARTSEDAVLPAPSPAVARQPRAGAFSRMPGASERSPRIALARPNIARSADEVRSILATQSQPADLPPPAAQLNVGELLARASGYNFGLRTIDSVLHERTSLDPPELTRLLSELEALLDQRGDLMLYEQLVSADVRDRLVRSLDFPQTTVAALGSRIATARERLAQDSGLAARQREVGLQTLADLSKRLARLSQNTD